MSPAQVYAYDLSALQWKAKGRSPISGGDANPYPYRDRSNTGLVRAGVSEASLTPNSATGISSSGTYQGVHFTYTGGMFQITASNVVLNGCKVSGIIRILNPASNVLITNCDIGAVVFQSCTNSIVEYTYWTNGFTGQDGIKVESYYAMAINNAVRYCYVGNSLTDENSHYDGFQSGGFQGFDLIGTTMDGGLGGLNEAHNVQIFTQNRTDIGGGRGLINDDLYVKGCHIRARGYNTLLLTGTNEVFEDNTFYASGTHEANVFHNGSDSIIQSSNNKWWDGRTAIPDGTIDTAA